MDIFCSFLGSETIRGCRDVHTFTMTKYASTGRTGIILSNLIPKRSQPKRFSLSRRICGTVLVFLGALLVGFGMFSLGVAVSLGGGLLLFMLSDGEEHIVIMRPSRNPGQRRKPSRAVK